MTTTHLLEIRVHASLPLNVALGANLNIDPTNWRWVHCLTLPIKAFNAPQISHRPYKWIRYAIGVVLGAEGVLCTSSDSANAVDYDTVPPAESADLYYHISDAEKRRMFPVIPSIKRSRITSSVHTPRRDDFRAQVADREGNLCIFTGIDQRACDAVHLLSHSKGDSYISTYTRHRSRDPTRSDIINEIDDIRNGLLLDIISHRFLGQELGFLRTPNFAMTTNDIDPAAGPTERRFTTHIFEEISMYSPPDSLEVPDTPEYPPAIVFDAVYAGCLLHYFGTPTLKSDVSKTWEQTFYPASGITNTTRAEQQRTLDEQGANEQKRQDHAQDRDTRHQARNPDYLDMLMILPYILVPPNELQAMLREAEENAKAEEQKHLSEKVDAWARQVITE